MAQCSICQSFPSHTLEGWALCLCKYLMEMAITVQLDPVWGIPPVHRPESAKSVPPAAKFSSGAGVSTLKNLQRGLVGKLGITRNHGTKSSSSKSTLNKSDVPASKSTGSTHEDLLISIGMPRKHGNIGQLQTVLRWYH